MFEKCLNEAESILSTHKDPSVRVRKVWEELNKIAKIKGFDVASLADFSAMLEGDRRFQIIPASMKNQDDEKIFSEGELEDDDMENLGFFSEDGVKLRSRRMVETAVNEDEEEVGSIKRCAFVSRAAKETPDVVKSKSMVKVKKSSSKQTKKNRPVKKIKIAKRTKAIKGKKTKSSKRKK